ncbi:hypothetical protein CkaCkLH20_00029 [Colletotrichum karsti]|uniref:Lumazine-binding protein n=1 Tax=Colletotrichum karsti TaxID=1095194 RepID=A0A9P6IEE8_9PEZI|nr:uncharacterized protein CkaCkLH20_00029 [Colletotrichum karsti]KAF9881993.1 hypothetical protein CkaCkLH20_00029 [Colletotrichum karsti]
MSNTKPIPTSDYEAVAAVVNDFYIAGCAKGDSTLLARGFHKDAAMYGHIGGQLLGGPIQILYDFIGAGGEAPRMKARVDVLAITPTTAVVRVDMEQDAAGNNYTDFHSLLKFDGEWKIISKVFHTYAS